jgi:FkbM family methyltransferase
MIKQFSFVIPQVERTFVMDDHDGRDFVLLQVEQAGLIEYEKPLPKLLVAYLAGRGGTCIDVGANSGLYTFLMASISSELRVTAFEPMAELYATLSRNLHLNSALSGRITAVPAAVSNTSGTVKFYETVNDMGYLSTSSTLEILHAEAVGCKYLSSEVPSVTLDQWSAENPVDDVPAIKIDVEGHEQGVLQGASAFIRKTRPLIALELLRNVDWTFFASFVRDNNYVNFVLGADCINRRDILEFDPGSWNHVLCPLEKIYELVLAARSAGLEIR